MNRAAHTAHAKGFSLVEVMVALIIVSVGLLGIAKMQALLLADTGVSRVRALVALEASSLAASIQANPDYWASAPNGLAVAIDPSATTPVVAQNDATLSSAISAAVTNSALCESTGSTACTAANMAGYDLVQWEQAMASVVGNAKTNLACSTTNQQVTCTITIDWQENTVNATAQEQGSTAFQNQSYQMVVQP